MYSYSYLYCVCMYVATVYVVIFKGCKFCGFLCKLVESETLILEKQYCLKEIMFQLDDQRKINHENPSGLPAVKYKTLENYHVYGI